MKKNLLFIVIIACLSMSAQSQNDNRPFLNRTVFNSYIELGGALHSELIPFTFDFNFGARVYDYAFIGLNIGVDLPLEQKSYSRWDLDYVCIPVGFDIRGFVPATNSFSPFFEFSSSLVFLATKYDPIYGARIRAGMGFEIKRFTFGMGYMAYRTDYGEKWNLGYFKLGVRIGKVK